MNLVDFSIKSRPDTRHNYLLILIIIIKIIIDFFFFNLSTLSDLCVSINRLILLVVLRGNFTGVQFGYNKWTYLAESTVLHVQCALLQNSK